MADPKALKAPYPYPGGKSKVADLVWSRLGNVDNYVEPFMGSLAVLLRRPADHFKGSYRVETCNDLNHFIANFWRAVRNAPDEVAAWADSPVLEADLHARHKWLVRSQEAAEWRERMRTDPEAFDAKIAGWWVWGQCCWIGGAWCNDSFVSRNAMPQIDVGHGVHRAPRKDECDVDKLPHMDAAGRGDAAPGSLQVPELSSGVGRGYTAAHGATQVPDLTSGGCGYTAPAGGRPQLTDAFDIGQGVNSGGQVGALKRPDLAGGNSAAIGGVAALPSTATCDARRAWLTDWMRRLADRLRLVRTCYGHWSRICDSESTMTRLGLTGVFLDPPYPANRGDTGKKSRDANLYATDKVADLDALRDEVLAWCRKWGGNPMVRVAVCGYEGDGYESLVPDGWSEESWEANGGYANQRRGGKGKAENAKRERIWFSPFTLRPQQDRGLFDDV